MLWLVGYHCGNLSNSPVQKQEKQAFGKNTTHIVSPPCLFPDTLSFGLDINISIILSLLLQSQHLNISNMISMQKCLAFVSVLIDKTYNDDFSRFQNVLFSYLQIRVRCHLTIVLFSGVLT